MKRSIQTLHTVRATATWKRLNLKNRIRRQKLKVAEIRDLLGQVVFSPLTPVAVRKRLEKITRKRA